MRKYKLYVYCRLNNVSRDSGLHSEFETDTNQQAIKELMRQARVDLLVHYDLVACTIVSNGNEIHKETIYR